MPVGWRSLVALILVGLTQPAGAVGRDKAILVGSTNPGFLKDATTGGRWIVWGWPEIEGQLDFSSDTDLSFHAGNRWSFRIPYAAITGLTYGRTANGNARGLALAFPWQQSSQFTNNAHYVLSISYTDRTGAPQSEVLELGKNLVRPTFEALERRTRTRVELLSVDACMQLKSAAGCGVGSPDGLRGLKRVYVEGGKDPQYRDNIVAEIEKADLGLQMVDTAENADAVLSFEGARFWESAKNIDGGRGEMRIVRDAERSLVVLVFVDRDTSVWGRAPSLNFGREFVKAYRKANER